ncbi:tRNA (adenosine(37)-N6)-dimethylallyltransferase MiaA [uncultured Anaerococcus sp.]|uniref:tRNA (adenosine(37)-N6)-dimethylallyltransferase MiaA n=1 Tax=uncultured Anaerococcus sp. TaxID=293428 RepID=UPI00261F63A9|nr:tRNA (adenosine(37)-N6)-dimethylallyltransferase MiaA [uncultured Anaerococcus sp.]
MKDKLIIITGPTASGKSDIAINLAKKLDSQIISSDSQQVYRYMDIGTNKVDDFTIDHHLINVVNPDENFTVEDFRVETLSIIRELNDNGLTPIMTGGTGFYIDSILFDMNYGKVSKNEELRDKLDSEAEEFGNEYLYEKLKEIDPESASKYHPNERNRIIRALEIYKETGVKASVQRTGERVLNSEINPILFFLNYENRDILYDKINLRVEQMIDQGLIEEFEYLIDRFNLTPDSQSMAAIGYKEIFPYIKGEINKDELIATIAQNTRRYAKRQITWMKRYKNYPFCHEIIMDELSKDDAGMIIESIIKDVYGL